MGLRTADGHRSRWSVSRWLPPTVAVAQAVVILGPVLGPGVAVRYDMAWSPDPRWTPFVLGLDTPAPRAVPSDAVAVLLGTVLGAGAAQTVILLTLLVAVGLGAALLVGDIHPGAGAAARTVGTVAAVWNPFVYERLMVGQWTVLAGLAILPFALRQVLRAARGDRCLLTLAAVVAVAGLGGANTLVIVLVATLPALLLIALGRRDRTAAAHLAGVTGVGLGVAAAWALPALAAGTRSGAVGAQAFIPVADSPLGVLGSLASGGGFWNSAVHPEARQVLTIAVMSAVLGVVGVVVALRRAPQPLRPVVAVFVGGPLLVVLISVAGPLQRVWSCVVTALPGGGLLRDSHKFVAPWVLVAAAGLGVLTAALQGSRARATSGPVIALCLGLPVVLSSFLVWGGLGRLAAVEVPNAYRDGIAVVNAAPDGDVGLLPWNQYRRYPWNDDRVSLTLAPRMLDRVVLFDDSLPLRAGTVPGESLRAARVTAAIDRGESPVVALTAEGVRYLVLERTALGEELVAEVRSSGNIMVDNPAMIAVDVGQQTGADGVDTRPVWTGWVMTGATLVLVLVGVLVGPVLRRVATAER